MKIVGILGALWAVIGVFGLLGSAVYRLGVRALEAFEMGFSTVHWIVLVPVVLVMAYSEGYKGFQKKFSPRTAARIHHLAARPNLLHSLLGPVFAMGFFHANRRTKIVAFSLTFGIICLVLLVRLLPQPWRGIVDAGVVVGLAWGMLSLAIFVVRALLRENPDGSPELPDPVAAE